MKEEPGGAWKNWHWQLANSITKIEQLKEELNIKDNQLDEKNLPNLPIKITPYYLELIKKNPILRKTVVPSIEEFIISDGESIDPLDEEQYRKSSCVIHKYYDRCLFLVTNSCATNCRFCTRSRIFDNIVFSRNDIDNGINYIKNHPEIRDVILSGGDMLTLGDNRIEYILKNIRDIKHVEIIRIGTKVPVVLPTRVNFELINMLKKYHPLYMSIHFTHPSEITTECSTVLNKLADAGIVLRSQTVLIKDVNDNIETMKGLMHKLLINRVSPYYLYYPDYIVGSSYFRPSIDVGIEIIKELRKSSGYCVPSFIVDSKYSKIVVNPENIIENNIEFIKIKSNNDEILEIKKLK